VQLVKVALGSDEISELGLCEMVATLGAFPELVEQAKEKQDIVLD
jgi:hypothetical protein